MTVQLLSAIDTVIHQTLGRGDPWKGSVVKINQT